MMKLKKETGLETGVPPLILIGALIVLFPIFAYMTIDSINRHKVQSIRMLADKSALLIRTIEAGTRSGMMDSGWSEESIKNLLKETASLPDIEYLFITDKMGHILLPDQGEKVAESYGKGLDLSRVISSENMNWRRKTGHDKPIFEAYKKFTPLRGKNISNNDISGMHGNMHSMRTSKQIDLQGSIIFVGLDMTVMDETIKNDIRHSILMAIILLLIGFSGFILVFLVQRFKVTKSSLSKMKVFSDNLVENMPIGLIALDFDNHIVSVNPAAENILKIEPDNHDGKPAEHLLPKELVAVLQPAKGLGNLIENEVVCRFENDVNIPLDVIVSPLNDNYGSSYGSIMLLRDLTEFKRLKEEVARSEKLASIGRLAAGVAHEIRNPLSSLKGYATYFKEVFGAESEDQEIAITMIAEVDRLNRVVSDLVELAKPVHLSGDLFPIDSLVTESLKLIEIEADKRGITIERHFELENLNIFVDQDRIKQVLLNLYLNALDAMENSGTLTVRIKKDGTNALVSIEDTGIGMNDEDLENIFEPYFTKKQTGTGLGLAIVHNIIKAHNCDIKVKSILGVGTIFEICLPLSETKNI